MGSLNTSKMPTELIDNQCVDLLNGSVLTEDDSRKKDDLEGFPVPRVRKATKTRKPRVKWTEKETNDLLRGCQIYGVGNWKKILMDERFQFVNRSPNDLKDRFRVILPEDYKRFYPNAKTHMGKNQKIPHTPGMAKASRKERKQFTPEEDERLLEGFFLHGPCWTRISKDASLGLQNRRSTDLRDRFRNAFPERYAAAGFKLKNNSGLRAKYDQSNYLMNDPSSTEAAAAAVAAVAAVAADRQETPSQNSSKDSAQDPSTVPVTSDDLLEWSNQSLNSSFYNADRQQPQYANESFLLSQALPETFPANALHSFPPYDALFPTGNPSSLPSEPQSSVQSFPFSVQQPPVHLEPPLESNQIHSSLFSTPNVADLHSFSQFHQAHQHPSIPPGELPWVNRG
ncbi:DNA-binding transcription factor Teb1 [Schizosaccharomyces osmophilus]|uniref:DNA-binding transcription factor Teb1 n=1 Tax=Schizosaccharomyces osmophilus TaxID=2545709 RepID=A0AAE9WBV9_9SCHI|nr:DNA-binding transcription factor Teb1 [Schizosaccharomyces osmophilus]WBW73507.1 DNA-binding transcription factor Teb1 [Schizosaccharomyces osmophilus]